MIKNEQAYPCYDIITQISDDGAFSRVMVELPTALFDSLFYH